ncbi:MAG TPA: DNA-binding protein [Bacteroidales bacterium]|nr:MAG: DNA-binding protein [Bacteroidetes bacterium GWF2_33_38]OFY89322.1 MAG: DNA-binding protein [Bacteroidetes bacterium RIFOXYA2_FULL_33_7]HBF89254.1 DNA-binding protein [Bacteroidales bacterium]
MEGFEKKESENSREEIFSKAIRAGKRTYFFDVKSTKRNEYYLTITESKKRFDREGNFHFEKHKIFLYKEDFEKFSEGLAEIVNYIKENAPEVEDLPDEYGEERDESSSSYSNVEFDDLENRK